METITEELRNSIRAGLHTRLRGDISGLSGDISGLRGYISSDLRGDIRDLRGDISGLSGDISGLRGDISGLSGYISGLRGDISGLRGDILAGKYPGVRFIEADADEVARLDAVREIVLNKPDRLRMDLWHSENWTPDHTPEEEHSCGSAHCIAGWLQALSPDPALRKLDALVAGRQLAPASCGMFFTNNVTALKWLQNREYDPATRATAAT